MAAEAKLQRQLIKFLTEKNIYHFKTIASNKAGIPDVVACIDGKFVTVEVKSDTGIQSRLQKYNQRRIEEEGGYYFLLCPFNQSVIFKSLERLMFELPVDYVKLYKPIGDRNNAANR